MIREIFMKDLARFTYFNAKMTTDISTYKFVVLPGWMVQPLWLAITHGDPKFKILHQNLISRYQIWSRSKTEIFNQWKFTFKCTTCIIELRARRLYNIPTITHINDIYNGDNMYNRRYPSLHQNEVCGEFRGVFQINFVLFILPKTYCTTVASLYQTYRRRC